MNNWNGLKLWRYLQLGQGRLLCEFDANPDCLIFYAKKITRGKSYIFISKGLVQQLISPNFDE